MSPLAFFPQEPDFTHEQQALNKGARLVAGIDEVGRGSLAGPVVVAAVILAPDHLSQGVRDSKRLSLPQRLKTFTEIMAKARAVSVAAITATEIDRRNIRTATLTAMQRALSTLEPEPDFALIDGRDIPPFLPCPALSLIKGDARSLSIASAAIVAKVLRDRMMTQAARDYPHYDFDKHAGYGTKAHIKNLQHYGAVQNWHRFSFAPLKIT